MVKYCLNTGTYHRYGLNKSIRRLLRQHSNRRRHIPAIFLRVDSIVCCHIGGGISRVYAAAGDNYAVPVLISCGRAAASCIMYVASPLAARLRTTDGTIKQSIGTRAVRKRAATDVHRRSDVPYHTTRSTRYTRTYPPYPSYNLLISSRKGS